MSQLKKLLHRFTGGSNRDEIQSQLRGFGKLPVSKEFIHIEAGQGSGKAFQNFLKAGHEEWVTCVPAEKRTAIASSCYFMRPEGLNDYGALGCLWPSQDAASPPRSFPFSFFVLTPAPSELSWSEQLCVWQKIWKQLQPQFDPAYAGKTTIPQLREIQINWTGEDPSGEAFSLMKQTSAIRLNHWLESLLASLELKDTSLLLACLEAIINQWRQRGAGEHLSLRLPLSPKFPYLPQTAAWLQWLKVNLNAPIDQLSNLTLPLDTTITDPSLCILTRSLRHGDFQLLTGNASDYTYVNDFLHSIRQLKNQTKTPHDKHLTGWLKDGYKSLWDWANYPI